MKIHILFDFQAGASGGGNQFLKALKQYFEKKNTYCDDVNKADAIVFNSHHKLKYSLNLKQKYPKKLFIHRIDGPITLTRDTENFDYELYQFNNYIADATIFQSEWSKQQNYKLGLSKQQFETTIINAPDISIFNKTDKQKFKSSGKIKIIATSWSPNIKKGFDVYKWLDNNLDFNKYEMTFCGNSPLEFKNIKHIQPLPSNELAKQLKQHDIYITATQKDACSNSLIEAMHCGLPAIALNDGGNPEIIKKGGELFNKKEEIPLLIKKIEEKYTFYTNNINLNNIEKTANMYFNFINSCFAETKAKTYKVKQLHTKNILYLKYIHWKFKILNELGKYINKK